MKKSRIKKMASISNNFNVLSLADDQNLIPTVAPSINWFQTYFIIWMWLAVSDDANEARAKTKKRRISRRIEERRKAPVALGFAPTFR